VAAATRVVDEDRRLGDVDQPADVVRGRQIGAHEACAAAALGDRPPAALLVDVRRHHLRAGARERQRDRAAGPDPRAGHDGDPASDVHRLVIAPAPGRR
jgi:hypothetical protein